MYDYPETIIQRELFFIENGATSPSGLKETEAVLWLQKFSIDYTIDPAIHQTFYENIDAVVNSETLLSVCKLHERIALQPTGAVSLQTFPSTKAVIVAAYLRSLRASAAGRKEHPRIV